MEIGLVHLVHLFYPFEWTPRFGSISFARRLGANRFCSLCFFRSNAAMLENGSWSIVGFLVLLAILSVFPRIFSHKCVVTRAPTTIPPSALYNAYNTYTQLHCTCIHISADFSVHLARVRIRDSDACFDSNEIAALHDHFQSGWMPTRDERSTYSYCLFPFYSILFLLFIPTCWCCCLAGRSTFRFATHSLIGFPIIYVFDSLFSF